MPLQKQTKQTPVYIFIIFILLSSIVLIWYFYLSDLQQKGFFVEEISGVNSDVIKDEAGGDSFAYSSFNFILNDEERIFSENSSGFNQENSIRIEGVNSLEDIWRYYLQNVENKGWLIVNSGQLESKDNYIIVAEKDDFLMQITIIGDIVLDNNEDTRVIPSVTVTVNRK